MITTDEAEDVIRAAMAQRLADIASAATEINTDVSRILAGDAEELRAGIRDRVADVNDRAALLEADARNIIGAAPDLTAATRAYLEDVASRAGRCAALSTATGGT